MLPSILGFSKIFFVAVTAALFGPAHSAGAGMTVAPTIETAGIFRSGLNLNIESASGGDVNINGHLWTDVVCNDRQCHSQAAPLPRHPCCAHVCRSAQCTAHLIR